MRFLNRKARAAEPAATEETPKVMYREIEITVQREWTSVTVRSPVEQGVQPTGGEEQEMAQAVPAQEIYFSEVRDESNDEAE